MVKWLHFNGYQRHFLFVALLGLYLLTANNIYSQFFQKHGKPAQVNINLPVQRGEIAYKLAEMRPVRVDGEDVYELKGFAFNKADPIANYTIQVVLISDDKSLAFDTSTVEFPGIIRSSQLYQPGLDDAEFRALISQRVLDAGSYRIGLLLHNKNGDEQIFTITKSTLWKTANTLRYKVGL